MNYGLYLSASGVLTNMYRQDVFTNNLANVETAGFKPDVPSIRQRDPETIEGAYHPEYSKRLLEKLGGGVLAGSQRIHFEPGAIQETGGLLDLALDDSDAFFSVLQVDATTKQTTVSLTRDGRLGIDAEGYLIQASSGNRVLDDKDQPIVIQPGLPVSISPAGVVGQEGQAVGQIRVSSVDDKNNLFKRGKMSYGWAGNDPRQATAFPSVKQGYIERSAVDPIRAMLAVTEATRAVAANARMISTHDRLMDQAVNVLGRVV